VPACATACEEVCNGGDDGTHDCKLINSNSIRIDINRSLLQNGREYCTIVSYISNPKKNKQLCKAKKSCSFAPALSVTVGQVRTFRASFRDPLFAPHSIDRTILT